MSWQEYISESEFSKFPARNVKQHLASRRRSGQSHGKVRDNEVENEVPTMSRARPCLGFACRWRFPGAAATQLAMLQAPLKHVSFRVTAPKTRLPRKFSSPLRRRRPAVGRSAGPGAVHSPALDADAAAGVHGAAGWQDEQRTAAARSQQGQDGRRVGEHLWARPPARARASLPRQYPHPVGDRPARRRGPRDMFVLRELLCLP